MKKAICFLTACVMAAGMSLPASAAVISVSDTYKTTGALVNGTTLIDKSTGAIVEENGTVFTVAKENPAQYVFKSGNYTYSLLDKDADGNYFILCDDRYGNLALNSASVNNIFDPDPATTNASYAGDTNVATWLNSDFLNGTSLTGTMTANKSMTAKDPALNPEYIVSHDWYIEGNSQPADEATHLTDVTTNDFTVNCKIALPSWSEYIKYSDKIGYASVQYKENNLTANHMILLRTPSKNAANMNYFRESTGNTASINMVTQANTSTSLFLRPCFYVSREYFRNTRLDVESMGDEVKNTLKTDFTVDELKTVYNDDEIAQITGSGDDSGRYVITDDMENGTDSWEKKTISSGTASAEAVDDSTGNKVMAIKAPTYAYKQLPVPAGSGTLTVEADLIVKRGNFGIGIIYDGKSNIEGKRYPLFIGNGQSKISSITDPSDTSWDVSVNASHYMMNSESNLTYTKGTKFRVKLIIDAETGLCIAEVDGKTSNAIDVSYIGKTNDAIGAIAFMNRSTSTDPNVDTDAYVDNVKISYDAQDSIISDIKTGGNKVKITLREGIDASTVTKDDIKVTSYDGAVKNLTKIQALADNSILVTVGNPMQEGQLYNIGIDSLKDDYPIVSKQFTYQGGEFSAAAEITEAKYASGDTVTAGCTVNACDFAAHTVRFITAAYKDGKLVSAAEKNINITADKYGEITDSVSFTLTGDADEIKAFVWDENQVPYNDFAHSVKTAG